MQFAITTDLTKAITVQEIAFNFDELKAELSASLEKYRGLVVTEESIADAKKARARLNALGKSINDEKISTKKQWNAPLETFIAKCGVLTGMVDEVSGEIDKKVKELEDENKRAKKANLIACFASEIGTAREFVTFDDIYDPKWMNTTVAEETAKEQIADLCERFKQDVGALKAIEAEPATKVVLEQRYKATKSLADVLRMKNDIEARTKLEAEAAERRAAERAAAQERVVPAPEPHYQPAASAPAATQTVRFQVTTTPAKLALLKQFLLDNDITYGAI